MSMPQLAVRIRPARVNHHLWNNHGTFWCHFTLHLPDYTKARVRLSLDTSDLTEARQLRDCLLALFGARPAEPAAGTTGAGHALSQRGRDLP